MEILLERKWKCDGYTIGMLSIDGKRLGDGKAWIISTAQQTLTEDDPRAALNSDKLYKLKDRFPIQIDLYSRTPAPVLGGVEVISPTTA